MQSKTKIQDIMKPTQHVIALIREARQQGKSLNRISKDLGLCSNVVSRWMRLGFGTKANG